MVVDYPREWGNNRTFFPDQTSNSLMVSLMVSWHRLSWLLSLKPTDLINFGGDNSLLVFLAFFFCG